MKKLICAALFYLSTMLIIPPNIIAQINFIGYTVDNNINGTGGIYSCDLDNDGDNDILAASLEDYQIIWYRNEGGNPITWTKFIIGSNVGQAHSVYAADFDNDGDLDVVGAAYSGSPGVAYWRNDGGNPIVWTKFSVASFNNAHEVFAYDIDKDGRVDILGASSNLNSIAWWKNDGGSPITWTEQILTTSASLAKSVCAGDIDGDGNNDIIGAAILSNDVILWQNEGGSPAQWSESLVDGNFNGAHRVQAIDMDKDGDLDILGTAYVGNYVAWWRNDGGTPISWTRQTIGTSLTDACVGIASDLDDDGDLDVTVTVQGKNQVVWFRNDGGSPIQWKKYIITNSFTRPWPLFIVDIDNDGKKDIVSGSSHNGSSEIKWWKNDGVVGIEKEDELPKDIRLEQNYPNPFNPTTTITYSIPYTSDTKLTLYNSLGQELRIFSNRQQKAGTYSIAIDGSKLSSGIYFYNLKVDQIQFTKKMLLLK